MNRSLRLLAALLTVVLLGLLTPSTAQAKDGGWTRLAPGYDMRFDPCSTIYVRVNTHATGDKAAKRIRVVRKSIKALRQASGLRIRYAGTTRGRPLDSKVQPHEILIGWTTTAVRPDLAGFPAGIGGWTLTDGLQILSGTVALDDHPGFRIDPGGRDGVISTQELIEHEMTHVLGLGHSDHGLMDTHMTHWQSATIDPGTAAGLRAVGGSQPCF